MRRAMIFIFIFFLIISCSKQRTIKPQLEKVAIGILDMIEFVEAISSKEYNYEIVLYFEDGRRIRLESKHHKEKPSKLIQIWVSKENKIIDIKVKNK